jgi:tyrosyl-tRNA synthetase
MASTNGGMGQFSESSFQRAVTANDLLFGKHLLLRKGKKNYVVVTAQ